MIRAGELPLWLNLLLFSIAAAVVWGAGTRLSGYVDALADRTGAGHVFLGALLLGGVTSLPEGATTITASAIGNAPLAVNNLFGGVAMQLAILAVADMRLRGRNLSSAPDDSAVLLQGVLLIAILAVAAMGIVVGETRVLGVGAWSTGAFSLAILSFWLMHRHAERGVWIPSPGEERSSGRPDAAAAFIADRGRSMRALVLLIVLASLFILAAGITLAYTADALAEQSGLGSSFVGAVLVAIATSLPEVSTTIGAVRLGAHTLAIANVIGANILDLSLLFLADLVYPGDAVLAEVGTFASVAALLGIVLTAVFTAGMLERRRTSVIGIGLDSFAVLVLYLGGLALLYTLR